MARYALIDQGNVVVNVIELEASNLCAEVGDGHPSQSCLKWHLPVNHRVIPSMAASPQDIVQPDGSLRCPLDDGLIEDSGGARKHACTFIPPVSRRALLTDKLRSASNTITPAEQNELLLLLLEGE